MLDLYLPMALCIVVFCVSSKISPTWLRGGLVFTVFVYTFGYAMPVNSKDLLTNGGWLD